MKRIPYAVASYEEIVGGGYYFVDKTRFIRELEQYKVPVFLRPRRFGKSLWCSILECYYDINRAERFDDLFGNTAIGRDSTPSHNRHLVLRFDFSKIEVRPQLNELERSFNSVCRNALLAFAAAYRNIADFGAALNSEVTASGALEAMLTMVKTCGTPPVHVIIDEYDNFTNQLLTAHHDRLYRELTTGDSFLRTFYKVIKAGVGEGTVVRAFVTGVLPVTMDDLTSGFNIGQIITLEDHVLEMMGFTQSEMETYLCEIGTDYQLKPALLAKVRDDLRTHYDGYRLLPEAPHTLYNSTICNFYLNRLLIDNGRIPRETIDQNLRVDVNWLRRLTGSDEETRTLVEQLMFDGTLPVDMTMLRSKFNMEQFFEKRFFPLSLYYLGMVTFRDRFTLEFPNLTVKTIFTEYFNDVENIEVSLGYTDMFRQFLDDHDWAALFAGYWRQYVSQIPAQAFDKVNENFFRTTFYELCTRYLSYDFRFAIEVNRHSGRSDWEAIGRANTPFDNQATVIEFKHFSRQSGESLGVLEWTEPRQDDVAQVSGYAADLKSSYPELTVQCHIVYIVGSRGFRFFDCRN